MVCNAAFICAVFGLKKLRGLTVKLPDVATPPRIEIFVTLLLLPSVIFITQAASSGNTSTEALPLLPMLAAVLMIALGLGWAVIHQMLISHTVKFAYIAEGLQNFSGQFDGAADRILSSSAPRKSSHGGFLVERDLPNQVLPSQFGTSNANQLADDDIDNYGVGMPDSRAMPAENMIQLFAEAQGATCRAWGLSAGPHLAADLMTHSKDYCVTTFNSLTPVAEANEYGLRRQDELAVGGGNPDTATRERDSANVCDHVQVCLLQGLPGAVSDL